MKLNYKENRYSKGKKAVVLISDSIYIDKSSFLKKKIAANTFSVS